MKTSPRAVFPPLLTLVVLASLATFTSGCAVVMAASQPPKRDVSVFLPGTPRAFLIAEIGEPVESEQSDGVLIDSFVFQQGYTKEVRALRAMVHGAADIATGGLWEFVATPFEAYLDGRPVRVQVRYDGVGRVHSADVYEGEKVMRALYGAERRVRVEKPIGHPAVGDAPRSDTVALGDLE